MNLRRRLKTYLSVIYEIYAIFYANYMQYAKCMQYAIYAKHICNICICYSIDVKCGSLFELSEDRPKRSTRCAPSGRFRKHLGWIKSQWKFWRGLEGRDTYGTGGFNDLTCHTLKHRNLLHIVLEDCVDRGNYRSRQLLAYVNRIIQNIFC